MKKKWLKIVALVVALLIIAGLCVFANALVGNPVSKWLATRTAEKHLEEVYGDTDFVIEKIGFNFKDIDYYAHIMSPSSEDSSFSLRIGMWGELLLDTYESRVLGGGNTRNRLYMEYRAMVDEVLESPDFPFASDIAYGDLQVGFAPPDVEVEEDRWPEGYLVLDKVELDKKYDMDWLALSAGRLVIYVEDDVVSEKRAAEILLELRRIFFEKKVFFNCIDLVLEYPRTTDGGKRKEGRINVEGILVADIYPDGLENRVHIANEKMNAYYAEQDAKNKELMEQLEVEGNE